MEPPELEVFEASNAMLLRSQGRAEASLPTFSGL